jgi:hypothetical protein
MGCTCSKRSNKVYIAPRAIHERLRCTEAIFTDKAGNVMTAQDAINSDNYNSVLYRGVRLNDLFNNMQNISEEGHDDEEFRGVEVFCGYSPYRDAFYYLHYVKCMSELKKRGDDCMICLEPLISSEKDDTDVAVRVSTMCCRHDVHYHCYKKLEDRNMTVAGCCREQNKRVAFHMKIVGYTEHRFIAKGWTLREYRSCSTKFARHSYNPIECSKMLRKTVCSDLVKIGKVNYCVGDA